MKFYPTGSDEELTIRGNCSHIITAAMWANSVETENGVTNTVDQILPEPTRGESALYVFRPEGIYELEGDETAVDVPVQDDYPQIEE